MSQVYARIGLIIKKEKYIVVKVCPIISNGGSTGRPPTHVNRKQVAHIDQNNIWFSG